MVSERRPSAWMVTSRLLMRPDNTIEIALGEHEIAAAVLIHSIGLNGPAAVAVIKSRNTNRLP